MGGKTKSMETFGERQRQDDFHWSKVKKLGQWRTIQSEERKGKMKHQEIGQKGKEKKRKNRETYTNKSLLLRVCFCGSSVNTTAFSVRARLNLP